MSFWLALLVRLLLLMTREILIGLGDDNCFVRGWSLVEIDRAPRFRFVNVNFTGLMLVRDWMRADR